MKKTIALSIFFLSLTACNARVPPGYVGMKMNLNGPSGEVVSTGLENCFGRERMVVFELAEQTQNEKLQILCADDLNFSFDLKLRSRLTYSDDEALYNLLTIQGKNINWSPEGNFGKGCDVGVLSWEFLYKTYVQPQARSIARDVVSKYPTTGIRDNRETIQAEIENRLKQALKGTPMQVTMVAASNFNYPEVITKAVEKKRAREIAIQEEEAKQKMEMLRAENRQKIAEKMKTVRIAEAEAEAAYNRITGESITPSYLQLRILEAKVELYKSIGQNDKLIFMSDAENVPQMLYNLDMPRKSRTSSNPVTVKAESAK